MTPWPWHAFTLDCALPPDRATALLASRVMPARPRGQDPRSPFFGKVDGSRFEVRGVIPRLNPFLTTVTGHIAPAAGGCQVHVRMRLAPLVHGVAIGYGVVGLVGSVFAVSVMRQPLPPVIWLLPAVMAGGTYAMATLGFWFEARLQERLLRDVFATA